MNSHWMRLPVGDPRGQWDGWLTVGAVDGYVPLTRSPSTRMEWVCPGVSQAGGDDTPDLLPALAPLGAGVLVTSGDWRACASCLVRRSGFRMATAAFGEAESRKPSGTISARGAWVQWRELGIC